MSPPALCVIVTLLSLFSVATMFVSVTVALNAVRNTALSVAEAVATNVTVTALATELLPT